MTHEKTHEPLAIRASSSDGYNRHTYCMVLGKNMLGLRESDLKLQFGTIFESALKS